MLKEPYSSALTASTRVRELLVTSSEGRLVRRPDVKAAVLAAAAWVGTRAVEGLISTGFALMFAYIVTILVR